MRSAFFSKCADSRLSRIKSFKGAVLLIHPKKTPRKIDGVVSITYEDLTKDKIWLDVNGRVSEKWTLVLECPSRYPRVSSTKVQYLQRLANKVGSVHIVDIVPFTLGIEYIYTPYSYLGRDILGYPHWYAFRENYGELINGEVVGSLSPKAIAPKIAVCSSFDYKQFSAKRFECIDVFYTENEKECYITKKDDAFNEFTTHKPIITRLADYSHACESRLSAIADIAQPGDAVFCNLQSYAAKLQRRLQKGAKAYSYAKPPALVEGRVIIAEPSIANDYQQLDAEALSDHVITIRCDLPVDRYLHGVIDKVRSEIDSLVKEI